MVKLIKFTKVQVVITPYLQVTVIQVSLATRCGSGLIKVKGFGFET